MNEEQIGIKILGMVSKSTRVLFDSDAFAT